MDQSPCVPCLVSKDPRKADAAREAIINQVPAGRLLPIQGCVARAVKAQVKLAYEIAIAMLAVFGR